MIYWMFGWSTNWWMGSMLQVEQWVDCSTKPVSELLEQTGVFQHHTHSDSSPSLTSKTSKTSKTTNRRSRTTLNWTEAVQGVTPVQMSSSCVCVCVMLRHAGNHWGCSRLTHFLQDITSCSLPHSPTCAATARPSHGSSTDTRSSVHHPPPAELLPSTQTVLSALFALNKTKPHKLLLLHDIQTGGSGSSQHSVFSRKYASLPG